MQTTLSTQTKDSVESASAACVCVTEQNRAEQMVERVDSRERNPQNPRNPTKTRKWENTPNLKPQTTRIQDPTRLLVGEGERGKQRSQDPQMGTSLAFFVEFPF